MRNLGKDNKYMLSDSALDHIIKGDISDRQDKDNAGHTVLKKIITGGLHTLQAWNDFLVFRPDIPHALLVDPMEHERWYYARRLQNGVILLKIPRDCFQSKAANITKFPETYYKSGYLWKTLFPAYFTADKIIETINDALNNISTEESTDSLIIGYANPNDFFGSIKIRIQIQGNEILSAFPTWEQPMTGNNGKPFSHVDSINTIISSSCMYARADKDAIYLNSFFKWTDPVINQLYEHTPEIIKNRQPPKKGKARSAQFESRQPSLTAYGRCTSEENIKLLFELATSDIYARYTYDFIRHSYFVRYPDIKQSLKFRNAVSLYENLNEILKIINAWDLENNGKYAYEAILHFLKVHFIRTGGLDQWEMKRLLNLFRAIVLSYNDPQKVLNFIKLLKVSPVRIGFYFEFNLNPYFYPDPLLIGMTSNPNEPLSEKFFYDFVAQNLGINYTSNFSDDFNLKIAKDLQISEHPHGLKILSNLISFCLANDFDYFAPNLMMLTDHLVINAESIGHIEDIIYDYHRCVAANIQRVLVKHRDILTQDLDFSDSGFTKHTKAKHEHKFLWVLNKMMIQHIAQIFKDNGFDDSALKLKKKYESLFNEVKKIPMPASVPKYMREDERI